MDMHQKTTEGIAGAVPAEDENAGPSTTPVTSAADPSATRPTFGSKYQRRTFSSIARDYQRTKVSWLDNKPEDSSPALQENGDNEDGKPTPGKGSIEDSRGCGEKCLKSAFGCQSPAPFPLKTASEEGQSGRKEHDIPDNSDVTPSLRPSPDTATTTLESKVSEVPNKSNAAQSSTSSPDTATTALESKASEVPNKSNAAPSSTSSPDTATTALESKASEVPNKSNVAPSSTASPDTATTTLGSEAPEISPKRSSDSSVPTGTTTTSTFGSAFGVKYQRRTFSSIARDHAGKEPVWLVGSGNGPKETKASFGGDRPTSAFGENAFAKHGASGAEHWCSELSRESFKTDPPLRPRFQTAKTDTDSDAGSADDGEEGSVIPSRVPKPLREASKPYSFDARGFCAGSAGCASTPSGVIALGSTTTGIVQVSTDAASTGEEGERNLFESKCKLFFYEESGWKERGKGLIRLNESHRHRSARLVMRADGLLNLILNASLSPAMKFGLMPNQAKSITGWITEDKRQQSIAIRLGTAEIARRFLTVLNTTIVRIPVKATGSPTKEARSSSKRERVETEGGRVVDASSGERNDARSQEDESASKKAKVAE